MASLMRDMDLNTAMELDASIQRKEDRDHSIVDNINRIAAGRLYDIAQALGVTISYFFEGLEQGGQVEMTPRQRMCLELARNFSMIQNGKHQEALSTLARSLADAS